MNQTFQCPACKKPLQFEGGETIFQICRHCKGKIIVPSSAVHQAQDNPPQMYDFRNSQKNAKLAEINSELQAGRTIGAIKVFRETFGTDLATAKEAIEAIQRGDNIQKPIEPQQQSNQRIYPNQSAANQISIRSKLAIIWFLISMGIAVAIIFLSK